MNKKANKHRHIERFERIESLGIPQWWKDLQLKNNYSVEEEEKELFNAVCENIREFDDPMQNWVDGVRSRMYSYFGARHKYDPACVDELCNFGQWYVLRDGSIFCDNLETGEPPFVIEATNLTEGDIRFNFACGYWISMACTKDFVVKALMTDFVRAFSVAWERAEGTNHNDKAFLKTLKLCDERQVLNPAEHWKVLFFLEVGQHNKTKDAMEGLKAMTEDTCRFLKYEDAIAYVARHPQQEEALRSMLEALLPKSEHDKLVDDIEEKRNQRNMYGCVFAMPGSTVNNTVAPPPKTNEKVQPLGISSLDIPEDVWQRLREAGKVDEEGMPTGSNADKALVAMALREAFGLTEFAPFERAWGFEPRFLSKQMDRAKARKTKDYRDLLSELHDIIGC